MTDLTNTGTGEATISADTANTPISSQPTSPDTGSSSTDWMSQLPDELKNEPSLTNFKGKGIHDIVKSYVSAQKELGSRIRIPGPDASPEVKADFLKRLETVEGVTRLPDSKDQAATDAFYAKLGVPKTADEYKIDVNPQTPLDPNALGQFKQLAHQLKLNNEQVANLVKFEEARTQQQIQHLTQQKDTSAAVLKQTWGAEFDNRIKAAGDIVRHFGTKYPEAANELMNGPAGNNPVLLMMAAELGKTYKESGVIKGESVAYGLTPTESRARISEIRANKTHPFHSRNTMDPKHTAAVEEMNKLYSAAYPDQGQSD